MSGGKFDYLQYNFLQIADDIDSTIIRHRKNELDEWEDRYSDDTLMKFEEASRVIRGAYVYVNRIDYLISGDDGEETFHERLNEDLGKLLND